MKLVCPCCGATASAESWENDMEARKTMQAIVALPREVALESLFYLGLFRPAQRALSWKAALRIVQELSELVAAGHVQVKGKPSRPCPPDVWAVGMRQMVAQRDTIARPLKNHNYLRQVVWQLADKLDADLEARRYQEERNGNARAERQQERQIKRQEEVVLTEAEQETLKKLGLDQTFKRMEAAQKNREK